MLGIGRIRVGVGLFTGVACASLFQHFKKSGHASCAAQTNATVRKGGTVAQSKKKCDVFLSHAGEQKREHVDCVHTIAKYILPGVSVFLDQHSLEFGDDADPEMTKAMNEAAVGVFYMSEDFVTKPYPMNELLLFLQRWKADPTEVSLAPVFYPLSVDQCSKIYADEKLWERNDREKPDDSVLKDWENAIAQLCRFTGVTPEMYNKFLGKMAEAELEALVPLLKKHKRVAASYTTGAATGEQWAIAQGHTAMALGREINKGYKEASKAEDRLRDIFSELSPNSLDIFKKAQDRDGAAKTLTPDQRAVAKEMNELRGVLRDFWVEITELDQKGALSPDFWKSSWLPRGDGYRLFCEPLDIATYYGRSYWANPKYAKGERHYLESDNRPTQYIHLEKVWIQEHPGKVPQDSTLTAKEEAKAIDDAGL